MGASSILHCCCFLLLFFSRVYCDNVKKPTHAKKEISIMKGEMQQMESFTGRKFGFGIELGRIKKWESVGGKEEVGIVLQRRLLKDNVTQSTNTEEEANAEKETAESGKEVEKQEVDGTTAEDKTEQETKLQVEVASSHILEENDTEAGKNSAGETTERIKEITLAGTPGNLTEATEQEIQSTLKENAVDLRENGMQETENEAETKTNSTQGKTKIEMQKIESKEAEKETKSAEAKTEIGMAKNESNEAEKQKNSLQFQTAIGRQETEKQTNSTEIQDALSEVINNSTVLQKTESRESETLTESKGTQVHNATNVESQEVESVTITNSTEALLQQRKNTVSKSSTNSTDNKTLRSDSTETSESITNSTKNTESESFTKSSNAAAQETESKETKTQAKSADTQRQKSSDSTGAETLANSSETETKEIETLPNSADTEPRRSEKTETEFETAIQESELLANSTDTETKKTDSAEPEILENSTEIQTAETAEVETLENSEDKKPNETENSVAKTSEGSGNIENKEIESNNEETSANSTGEIDTENSTDESEDEYSNLIQEFADLPSNLHDTAEQVADRLLPGIQKLSNKSKVYFNLANEEIAQGFQPLVGKHYAPFVATGVSFLFLLLPLMVAIVVFEQIRAFFPLQKVLLLANIFLANYFASLMFASFVTGIEPMEFFYRNSPSGYIYLQLVQGLGFVLYLCLHCFNMVSASSSKVARLMCIIQFVVAVCIGLHYYMTVFRRAMVHKTPRTCWRVHGIYALLFGILCVFSKIRQGKKEYLQGADSNTHKKN